MEHEFTRMEMLVGADGLYKLKNSTVAVFGIGGVGSFVVEGLVRAGIGSLILIDMDDICISNINRQLHATSKTLGRAKVEVMGERVLDINPSIKIQTYRELYNHESAERLLDNTYSYVVDAIDMVSAKLDLITRCIQKEIPIISCMGAGNRLNPTMLEVGDIYATSVCPLAKVMRRELRKRGVDSLKVVYSKEPALKPRQLNNDIGTQNSNQMEDENLRSKKNTIGSVSFVPSVAGLIIASEVVKDLLNKTRPIG